MRPGPRNGRRRRSKARASVRICTFEQRGVPAAGVVAADDTVISTVDLLGGATDEDDVLDLLLSGEALLAELRSAARKAKGGVPLRSATLHAPIPRPPRNVFCIGWNYSEHFEEGKQARGQTGPALAPQEIPQFPAIFTKNPATVVGTDAAVLFPAPHSEQLDWEAELAVVIGKGGRDITEADAMHTCSDTRARTTSRSVTCSAATVASGSKERTSTRTFRWDPGSSPPTISTQATWPSARA